MTPQAAVRPPRTTSGTAPTSTRTRTGPQDAHTAARAQARRTPTIHDHHQADDNGAPQQHEPISKQRHEREQTHDAHPNHLTFGPSLNQPLGPRPPQLALPTYTGKADEGADDFWHKFELCAKAYKWATDMIVNIWLPSCLKEAA